ncbi:MAG: proteasome accessory factor PafA2, partial [Actinobacteria bacterium]
MISVSRIQGIETEYALLDAQAPHADPDKLATDLLYAYLKAEAAAGKNSHSHVPAPDSRSLLPGVGTRFDYSGETPSSDARGFTHENLPQEAQTHKVRGA